jgi:hypothetical protein
MPKGHKVNGGYATVGKELGGLDYRSCAERMTADGDKMNHATARNVFLKAMKKIAKQVADHMGHEANDEDIIRIAKHPSFQGAIQDVMHDELGGTL